MQILEKDCKIEYDGMCYTLYVLKSKKELSEDKTELYIAKGYYKQIYNAFNAVHRWRTHKKYPFQEESVKLKRRLTTFRQVLKFEIHLSELLYQEIPGIKQIIFDEHKQLQY